MTAAQIRSRCSWFRISSRSHAWVMRGEEYVEARPMNWGDNLTLIGALFNGCKIGHSRPSFLGIPEAKVPSHAVDARRFTDKSAVGGVFASDRVKPEKR